MERTSARGTTARATTSKDACRDTVLERGVDRRVGQLLDRVAVDEHEKPLMTAVSPARPTPQPVVSGMRGLRVTASWRVIRGSSDRWVPRHRVRSRAGLARSATSMGSRRRMTVPAAIRTLVPTADQARATWTRVGCGHQGPPSRPHPSTATTCPGDEMHTARPPVPMLWRTRVGSWTEGGGPHIRAGRSTGHEDGGHSAPPPDSGVARPTAQVRIGRGYFAPMASGPAGGYVPVLTRPHRYRGDLPSRPVRPRRC